MVDVDARGLWDTTLSTLGNFIPKFIAFVVILLIGWLIAMLLAKVVHAALDKARFNRLLARSARGCPVLNNGDFDAAALVSKLVYFVVVLFALQVAFGVWGPNPVSHLIAAVIAWLPLAVVAVVILIVTAYLAKYVRDLLRSALTGVSYGRLLSTIAFWFIMVLGIIAALNQVGIATTVTTPVLVAFLATVAGILIVGVGGGLVRPMAALWADWLPRVREELPHVAQRVADAEAPVMVEPEVIPPEADEAATADAANAADDVDTEVIEDAIPVTSTAPASDADSAAYPPSEEPPA
jgi:hypothetical protein